jgi:hypothetical protein
LAPQLTEPLLADALATARSITDERARAEALAGLAPQLTEPLLADALATGRSITDERARAKALAGLAPHLSEPLLADALTAARSITDEHARTDALAGLAPQLSQPRRVDLVEEFRSVALATDLLLSLQTQARRSTWPRMRFILLDAPSVMSCLYRLGPVVPDLASASGAAAIVDAIRDVSRWWS